MRVCRFIKLWSILIIILLVISTGSFASTIRTFKPHRNSVQFSIFQASPDNVYDEIVKISEWYRYLDTPGHRSAENYIFSKFESYDLNTTRQEYTCHRRDGDVRGANVLGLLEGEAEPDKWLVLGGHYDANQYSTYAAYDNAAGTATVLELARYFSDYYQTNDGPSISILFATWDAEEGGGAGSKYFLENLPVEIDIMANLNFDMYSLNYPVRNSIPGSTEEYFKLNLYTSPVNDFSRYSNIEFDESTQQNFTIFQELLINITYTENGYPNEWVPIMDDTAVVSDHAHFIRKSIPAVWFRGMNEYPRDEGDLNERNFKHTPVDTINTMERYAGGKAELLKGIDTGLTIATQFVLELLNLHNLTGLDQTEVQEEGDEQNMLGVGAPGWLIAIAIVIIIIFGIYWYSYRKKK